MKVIFLTGLENLPKLPNRPNGVYQIAKRFDNFSYPRNHQGLDWVFILLNQCNNEMRSSYYSYGGAPGI
jgi:hypothetical protein